MSDLQDIRQEKIMADVNGKDMQIEYDFNALAYIEEQTGLGRHEFFNLISGSDKGLTTKQELILIHAGLIRHNEKITLKEVGRIQSFDGIAQSSIQAYFKIFIQPEIYNAIYFPEEEKKEADNSEEKKD